MKFKNTVIVTQSADEYILVTAGEAAKAFSGMIVLNETAAFIARALQHDTDVDQISGALTAEYEVSPEKARGDVADVLNQFRDLNLLEE